MKLKQMMVSGMKSMLQRTGMNRYFIVVPYIVGMGLFLLLTGCEQSQPPEFRLNMVQMVSLETAPAYQQEIADVLGALFGTPDEPFAMPETGLDQSQLKLAAGPAWSGEEGSVYGLYRKHCVHCHGVTGDGRGPTARFLNPYPRDYRAGTYKFKSTYNATKPTDKDLYAVLYHGVPGTAMPSFALLPSSEIETLVEYVKYLSMRGQMETELINYVAEELGEEDGERIPFDPVSDQEQRGVIQEILAEIASDWGASAENVIQAEEAQLPQENRTAEEIAASVELGRALFYGNKANCLKCHGPTALGDGQRDDQDIWNKSNKKFQDDTALLLERVNENQGTSDLDAAGRERLATDVKVLAVRETVAARLYPVRNAIPRNLRKGIYRGGRRPLDIYRRVHAGIPGTPMPGSGPASLGAKGTLTDVEIWNVVDYVLSLPYEGPSQPQRALPVNAQNIAN
ncbi:MAG: cytochrome c [Pirellulales bacterium]